MGWTRLLAALSAVAVLVAGCTDSSRKDAGPTTPSAPSKLGANEDQLDLLAWPGYVENGSTDKNTDWVSDFVKETGCKVSVKTVGSSAEMAALLETGAYDGLSARGDISRRLMLEKKVAPVNTKLVPGYAGVVEGLRDKPWNSLRGKAYGVPIGRTADVLVSRSDTVKPAPTSLAAVFDPNVSYKGKVAVQDTPVSLAQAALYLRVTKPELKISNPYALTAEQFDAAVTLSKGQKDIAGLYWTDYVNQVNAMEDGNVVAGTSPQIVAELTKARGTGVGVVVPDEGTTGQSDTWMVAADAPHPNCMYRWMAHTLDPKVNARVAEYQGIAPSVAKACENTGDKQYCETFHATDESFYSRVWFSTTPTKQCVDRAEESCVDADRWTKAWESIRPKR